jgi:hypothetical protein
LVQGREWFELREFMDDGVVDPDRCRELDAAMNDPMAHGDKPRVARPRLAAIENEPDRLLVIESRSFGELLLLHDLAASVAEDEVRGGGDALHLPARKEAIVRGVKGRELHARRAGIQDQDGVAHRVVSVKATADVATQYGHFQFAASGLSTPCS